MVQTTNQKKQKQKKHVFVVLTDLRARDLTSGISPNRMTFFNEQHIVWVEVHAVPFGIQNVV